MKKKKKKKKSVTPILVTLLRRYSLRYYADY